MNTGRSFKTGFEKYHVLDDDDILDVLKDGIVALDANVLLDLYRYPKETSDDLLRSIEQISTEGRLFVPHQVATEFWRGRLAVIAHIADPHSDVEKALRSYENKTNNAISVWAKSAFLMDERRDELLERISFFFTEMITAIHEDGEGRRAFTIDTPTTKDQVLLRLEEILDGRVGPPLNESEYEDALAEAQRRREKHLPPGFGDASKEDQQLSDRPEGGAGDYLVWLQMLQEAQHREQDLLFVTRDEKSDWWLKWQPKDRSPILVGAHQELIAEFHTKTGRRLVMLTPDSFLEHSSKIGIDVNPRSIENVRRLEQQPSGNVREIALEALHTQLSKAQLPFTLTGLYNRGSSRLRLKREDGSSSPLYFTASKNHWETGGTSGWHTIRHEDVYGADYSSYVLAVLEDGEPTFFILTPSQMKQVCEGKDPDTKGLYHLYICSEIDGVYKDDREHGGGGADFTQFLNAWDSLTEPNGGI